MFTKLMISGRYLIAVAMILLLAQIPLAYAASGPSTDESQSGLLPPMEWNVGENLSVKLDGYAQFEGYSIDKSSAPFGTGVIPNRSFDTAFRRLYAVIHGNVYGWNYLFVYNFADDANVINNGIIWAWASHKLGPGNIFLGQRWTNGSLEEGPSSKGIMFISRNFTTSLGITGLRNHVQGVFYDISRPYGNGHNNIFWSVAGYSLNNTLNNRFDNSGYGGDMVLKWAPIVRDREWFQIGTAVVYNKATGNGKLSSAAPHYITGDAPVQVLASYGAMPGSPSPHSWRFRGNIAGSYEGLFGFASYAQETFHQSGQPTDTVRAYAVQMGYWLTGESTPFDRKYGSYGTPAPIHRYGAVQLMAAYDHIENADVDNAHPGVGQCVSIAPGSSPFTSPAVTNCEIDRFRVGVNYWVNPMIRLTGTVNKSFVDLGDAGLDNPTAFALNAELIF